MSSYTIKMLCVLKSNHRLLMVGGSTSCNLTTNLSGCNKLPLFGNPIYHPHISINNHGGMQLVSWKGCKNHVTDQSSKGGTLIGVIHSQQFVPRSAWTHAVYLLYMKHSRLEICICQTSPITPVACHTWGSSQPTRKKKKKKTECSCQQRTLSGLKRHQLPQFLWL